MATFSVKVAIYGAMNGSDTKSAHANDVTSCLQAQLNSSSVVKISNDTLGGDAYKGHTKHFAAVVLVNGIPAYFACQEGQTIDFAYYSNGQGHC